MVVVLAAIASRTTRMRLSSAVTVLSSDDPIRVFQRISTVDAASNGRTEVIASPTQTHQGSHGTPLRDAAVKARLLW